MEVKGGGKPVQYNLFLLGFIPLLLLVTKFIPKLSSWISTRFFRLTSKEREQLEQIRAIQKEMKGISMVDEFARHAKLQRKLNLITIDLEASGDCQKALQNRVYKWVLGTFSVMVGITYLSMMGYFGGTVPVFVGPKYWFYPLHHILAYPCGIEGAVSIPMWTILVRNVISVVVRV